MTDPLLSLDGRTALVTGGTRGIGLAIAATLLRRGAKVLITGRTQAACDTALAELAPLGVCHGLAADLDSVAGVRALAAKAPAQIKHLDILVQNAGAGSYRAFDAFQEADWDQVLDLNLKGVFFLTQSLHPLLKSGATAENPSRIIHIGSAGGMQVSMSNAFSYGVSKAGLNYLTRKLALRLAGDNITVNTVSPGPVSAGLMLQLDAETQAKAKAEIPLGRFATAEEVAAAVLFLASPMGGYITGAILPVDGGVTGCMH